jgi:hypothetical protein
VQPLESILGTMSNHQKTLKWLTYAAGVILLLLLGLVFFAPKLINTVGIKEKLRQDLSRKISGTVTFRALVGESALSEDLAKTLTYEDKLDRSPENIKRLISDGEKQGQKFIEVRFREME